jgi:hypothetical protein
LAEFLQRSRELFPDTVVEVVSTFQSGDTAIAEWKLTATDTVSFGSMKLRSLISLSGVSTVQSKKEQITQWSDYYDQVKSRRVGLPQPVRYAPFRQNERLMIKKLENRMVVVTGDNAGTGPDSRRRLTTQDTMEGQRSSTPRAYKRSPALTNSRRRNQSEQETAAHKASRVLEPTKSVYLSQVFQAAFWII